MSDESDALDFGEQKTNELARIRLWLVNLRDGGASLPPELEAAWKEFHREAERLIRAQVASRARREERDDLIQEIWLSLLSKLNRDREITPDRTWGWLSAVIHNELVNLLKRERRCRTRIADASALEGLADQRSSSASEFDDRDEWDWALNELRSQVGEATWSVVRLRLVDRASLEEIAKKLGISVNAARVRFHRGFAKLKAIMGVSDGDLGQAREQF